MRIVALLLRWPRCVHPCKVDQRRCEHGNDNPGMRGDASYMRACGDFLVYVRDKWGRVSESLRPGAIEICFVCFRCHKLTTKTTPSSSNKRCLAVEHLIATLIYPTPVNKTLNSRHSVQIGTSLLLTKGIDHPRAFREF